MARASRDLLNEVLDLPPDERAKIAEEDVEAAWATEIEARVAAARAGEIESTDWREVMARVEREYFDASSRHPEPA